MMIICKRTVWRTLALASLLALGGGALPAVSQIVLPPPVAVPRMAISSWGYQLSNLRPEVIAASDFDVVVIDYARDGTQGTALTAAEVQKMKVRLDGSRRLVLAYLSIGEAEVYRYYWSRRWSWFGGWYGRLFGPGWLGRENREWRGNYAVRYWRDDWQALISGPGDSYLGRILAAGFDGVWLDKVDANTESIAASNKTAAADMVKFVTRIAARARAEKPNFLIIPQNGEELLADPMYRAVIDGIGAESLLYGDPVEKKPTAAETQQRRLPPLQALAAEGKPVLAVEYLDKPGDIASARARLLHLGFTPYFTGRNLDNLRPGDVSGR